MVQKAKIMGSGIAALATQNIGGTCESAITATGSSQATAYQLNSDVNEVTTTASSTGVILPASCSPGDSFTVYNIGANTLAIYPPTGESINALSANAAYSPATAKVCLLTKVSATRWCAGVLA